MKHIKLFEAFRQEDAQYSMITQRWNHWLVPTSSLKTRPKSSDFSGEGTTDEYMEAFAKADDRWFSSVEHFYCSPELLDSWGYKEGWGSKTKDLKKVFRGIDFEVEERENVTMGVKIARGAPTVTLKKALVAIPV